MSDTATHESPTRRKLRDSSLVDLGEDILGDQAASTRRSRIFLAFQFVFLAFVLGYMTWLFGAVGALDAEALTSIASDRFEAMLPDLREDAQEYAISIAPELTDQAQEALLALPHTVGGWIEEHVSVETEKILAEFEMELEANFTAILESQISSIRSQYPDATVGELADQAIRGITGTYREEMRAAVDAMYERYAEKVRQLDRYLVHLQTSEELTETERLDKELIEAWVALVHTHQITVPESE